MEKFNSSLRAFTACSNSESSSVVATFGITRTSAQKMSGIERERERWRKRRHLP
jgi:hypothetical protein